MVFIRIFCCHPVDRSKLENILAENVLHSADEAFTLRFGDVYYEFDGDFSIGEYPEEYLEDFSRKFAKDTKSIIYIDFIHTDSIVDGFVNRINQIIEVFDGYIITEGQDIKIPGEIETLRIVNNWHYM